MLVEKKEEKKFVMWNKFPSSARDLSFLIDRKHDFKNIKEVIEKYKPAALEDYTLTGLYDGKGIPQEKISILMSFKYRSPDKTLKNDEVNELHDSLVNKLVNDLSAIRR